jgi:hypothetical protein
MMRTWVCKECGNSPIESGECTISRDTKKQFQRKVAVCPFYVDTFPVWVEVTEKDV